MLLPSAPKEAWEARFSQTGEHPPLYFQNVFFRPFASSWHIGQLTGTFVHGRFVENFEAGPYFIAV